MEKSVQPKARVGEKCLANLLGFSRKLCDHTTPSGGLVGTAAARTVSRPAPAAAAGAASELFPMGGVAAGRRAVAC